MKHNDKSCSHKNIVRDEFSKLAGVSRYVEGDGYCLDCKSPVPYKEIIKVPKASNE